MNKYSTLLLAGAVALSFASCQKDNTSGVVNPDSAVGTFASIKASEAGLRAVTDGQQDAAGVGGESLIANGTFYAKAPSTVTGATVTGLTFTPAVQGVETYWQTAVFKYTGETGNDINSALALNGLASTPALGADTEVQITDLSNLAAETGFTMTSASATTINILPDIAQTDVKAGTNQFDYTVERVVSKVQVAQSSSFVKGLAGEIKDLRYAVAGSAKEAYYFLDNAGNRTLDKDTPKNGYGTAYKSAIDAVPASTFKGGEDLSGLRDLQKVSDKSLVAVGDQDGKWATLNSLPLTEDNVAVANKESSTEGIFFLENSMAGFTPAADNSFKYADITYVKIYGTYVPGDNEVWTLDKSNPKNPNPGLIPVSAAEVAKERKETVEKDGTSKEYTWKAGSFFKGDQTGKLYLTLEAARHDGNTTSQLYEGGKMVWLTPANKQVDNGVTVYPFTRRNNIYSLSIDAIKNFGDNFDPIDPTDPNIPKPENPDEPVTPPDTPVDTHDTSIQVRAAILNWNLVSRGVNL
ncbi:MAG: Mfa1 family fimbria major subunit [Bacteroidales bacterium]|nr:Mfa1 family fimbria major subunit [Bacteroidales bacterium]